jgi:hypothetical protein
MTRNVLKVSKASSSGQIIMVVDLTYYNQSTGSTGVTMLLKRMDIKHQFKFIYITTIVYVDTNIWVR